MHVVNLLRARASVSPAADHQDIEATDLKGSDFDKADCSYTDFVGAHMQNAINVNNACFAPPTPGIGGKWTIDGGADPTAKIHVRAAGRAIVGKATFMRKDKPDLDAVVSGRLDPIATAEARAILKEQSEEFAAEEGVDTKVPVHRGEGMPLARFRMEFLAASALDRDGLLEASGIAITDAISKGKSRQLLAYVGTVWLVGASATDGKKRYSLRGFVPLPPSLT